MSTQSMRKLILRYAFVFYIIPGTIYFLWRYLYYDLLLPLPFYVKVLHGGKLLGGVNDVRSYLLYVLPSVSILLLISFYYLKKESIPVLIPIVFLLTFYLFPVHIMGFDWRFVYPTLPFISILVALGAANIFQLLSKQENMPKPWDSIFIFGLFFSAFFYLQGLGGFITGAEKYGTEIISKYKELGTILNQFDSEVIETFQS